MRKYFAITLLVITVLTFFWVLYPSDTKERAERLCTIPDKIYLVVGLAIENIAPQTGKTIKESQRAYVVDTCQKSLVPVIFELNHEVRESEKL